MVGYGERYWLYDTPLYDLMMNKSHAIVNALNRFRCDHTTENNFMDRPHSVAIYAYEDCCDGNNYAGFTNIDINSSYAYATSSG